MLATVKILVQAAPNANFHVFIINRGNGNVHVAFLVPVTYPVFITGIITSQRTRDICVYPVYHLFFLLVNYRQHSYQTPC